MPLGTRIFLALQNLTEWPLFKQEKQETIDCFDFLTDCFLSKIENGLEKSLFLLWIETKT